MLVIVLVIVLVIAPVARHSREGQWSEVCSTLGVYRVALTDRFGTLPFAALLVER